MADEQITPEVRVTHIQSILKGRLALEEYSKCPARNIHMGVLLRSCARLVDGHPLSDLEENTVNMYEKYIEKDELRAYGQAFKSAPAEAIKKIFPAVIYNRPIEQPYTKAQLRKDLMETIGPQLAALPNFKCIDPEDIITGKAKHPDHDDDFDKAKEEYGGGCILYFSKEKTRSVTSLPLIVKANKFKCLDESNEWSGSEEIYWCTSASSESESSKKKYNSNTFYNVDKGETKTFKDDAIIFDGVVTKALTYEVECWEEDHQRQFVKMNKMLDDIKEHCWEAIDDLEGEDDTELATAMLFVATVSANLIKAVFGGWLKDDLVRKMNYAFNIPALQKFMSMKEEDLFFTFRGHRKSGSHRLWKTFEKK